MGPQGEEPRVGPALLVEVLRHFSDQPGIVDSPEGLAARLHRPLEATRQALRILERQGLLEALELPGGITAFRRPEP